ncbi:MAG TPA: N-acetyltransferase family protein [Rhabdaerophilum sp.]|nr:N-acetyltransferase family protein [Rhabdaerophilum sp.]
MAVLVRASCDADLPAIQAIYTPAVLNGTASFELEPPDLAEMARRRAALLADGFPYLVAEIAGAIVGYAYAGQYRPRPAYRHAVEDSIYIKPDCQGQGVGKALLAALIAECQRLGKRQMVAVIGDSLSHGSINLHRAMGFAHAGTVRNVGYKHGRWLDQVIYQRALGPGAETAPEA